MIVRRQLLQVLAGTAVLPGSLSLLARAQGLGTDYDVIIIGAGVAGLAAAEHLASIEGELKVLVLEARDRIGGRIHSVGREGLIRNAELGAYYLLSDDGADWPAIEEHGLTLETLPDDRLTLRPGMSAIVEALSEASSGKVQLSSVVTELFWREGLVGVNYRNRGLSSAVTARRLIFAIPPGVLASGDVAITPPLPDSKRRAVASMDASGAISCAMVFSAADARIKDGATEWIRETDTVRHRAFMAGAEDEVLLEAQYRGGSAAALAGQSNDTVLALSLRSFADALDEVPALSRAQWTETVDWAQESFSRGARTVAAATSTHLSLAESLYGTLFFAGEATADPSAVGTVHGAYASGRRAAREVALSLGEELQAPDANEPILELLL